jgi:hypothetical protein
MGQGITVPIVQKIYNQALKQLWDNVVNFSNFTLGGVD